MKPKDSNTFALRGARVEYGGRLALGPIDLEIPHAQSVALVGPSGSGKSTLLRLLNASLPATGGEAIFEGRPLQSLQARELRHVRAAIGFVHQDHSLVPNLRVSQNVIAGKLGTRNCFASMRSMLWPGRADLERAHRILQDLGIEQLLFQRVCDLSGGEQQRVALARALFQDPRALLADEPVASVDPARSRDLIEQLCDSARSSGLTLIASLHDLPMAREFFDRTIGLRGGQVVFDRPTKEVEPIEFEALYRLEGAHEPG